LPNVCDLQKEAHTLGYEFKKNYSKSIVKPSGILFFVISISGLGKKNPLELLHITQRALYKSACVLLQID
jgi:hypothetical protein